MTDLWFGFNLRKERLKTSMQFNFLKFGQIGFYCISDLLLCTEAFPYCLKPPTVIIILQCSHEVSLVFSLD